MKSITFTLDGPPQGKGRARSTRGGIHYTPAKTASYETRMAWTFKQAAPEWQMLDGAVGVIVTAKFEIPKSWSKKKRMEAMKQNIRPTVKPDWDNIAKTLDALNGIAWRDDSQIVSGIMRKRYSEKPGLVIMIFEERIAEIKSFYDTDAFREGER